MVDLFSYILRLTEIVVQRDRIRMAPDRNTVLADAKTIFPFDISFYRAAYPDLANENDLLAHFLAFGADERRYGSRAQLDADIAAVEAAGAFDPRYVRDTTGERSNLVEYYLLNIKQRPLRPNPQFDFAFIEKFYPKTLARGENPFAFYCRHSKKPWCFPSQREAERDIEVVASSTLFDAGYYSSAYGIDAEDAAAYYCTEGFRVLHNPSRSFSTLGYLKDNPDIAEAEVNPLIHYENFGRAEERSAPAPDKVKILDGAKCVDPAKRTILICSHEGSRTGAPVVGLNLARCLSSTYNVVSCLLRNGPLAESFLSVSSKVCVLGNADGQIDTAVRELFVQLKVDAVILNSVESCRLLDTLVELGVPIVTLIHEFASYVYPFDKITQAIALSDQVVFPANIVFDDACAEASRLEVTPFAPSNVQITHQGRGLVPGSASAEDRRSVERSSYERAKALANDQLFTVLGAGFVQPRKGVDLFIETARRLIFELKVPARFIWVGANYSPEEDMLHSVYLKDQIHRSDLQKHIFFIDEQPDLEPFWRRADAFFLSSKLDPFPNVAIDALVQGLPVFCFDRATGIAELLPTFPDQVKVAPYYDCAALAEHLAAAAALTTRPSYDREAVRQYFSFQRYADNISKMLDAAIIRLPKKAELFESLMQDDVFDPQVFEASAPRWLSGAGGHLPTSKSRLARDLVASAMNNLARGLVRFDRTAEFDESEAMTRCPWVEPNVPCVLADLAPSEAEFSLIVITNKQDVLDSLAVLAFGQSALKAVLIVTDELSEEGLRSFAAVREQINLSLISFKDMTASMIELGVGGDRFVGVLDSVDNISSEMNAPRNAFRANPSVDFLLQTKPYPALKNSRPQTHAGLAAAMVSNSNSGVIWFRRAECAASVIVSACDERAPYKIDLADIAGKLADGSQAEGWAFLNQKIVSRPKIDARYGRVPLNAVEP